MAAFRLLVLYTRLSLLRLAQGLCSFARLVLNTRLSTSRFTCRSSHTLAIR